MRNVVRAKVDLPAPATDPNLPFQVLRRPKLGIYRSANTGGWDTVGTAASREN